MRGEISVLSNKAAKAQGNILPLESLHSLGPTGHPSQRWYQVMAKESQPPVGDTITIFPVSSSCGFAGFADVN